MKLVGESDMQKAGSAVTYARRYTLGALLAMKAEDDDGNTASGKTNTKTTTATSTSNAAPTDTTSKSVPTTKTAAPAAKPSFRKTASAPKLTPKPEPVAETTSGGDDL
jgi:hypothetical protein